MKEEAGCVISSPYYRRLDCARKRKGGKEGKEVEKGRFGRGEEEDRLGECVDDQLFGQFCRKAVSFFLDLNGFEVSSRLPCKISLQGFVEGGRNEENILFDILTVQVIGKII